MGKGDTGNKPALLYKAKFGTVHVTIIGPRLGWEWTRVSYHRYVPSTKEPGKFERRPPERAACRFTPSDVIFGNI